LWDGHPRGPHQRPPPHGDVVASSHAAEESVLVQPHHGVDAAHRQHCEIDKRAEMAVCDHDIALSQQMRHAAPQLQFAFDQRPDHRLAECSRHQAEQGAQPGHGESAAGLLPRWLAEERLVIGRVGHRDRAAVQQQHAAVVPEVRSSRLLQPCGDGLDWAQRQGKPQSLPGTAVGARIGGAGGAASGAPGAHRRRHGLASRAILVERLKDHHAHPHEGRVDALARDVAQVVHDAGHLLLRHKMQQRTGGVGGGQGTNGVQCD